MLALTYAAESGEVIARWKLGQMYAKGDGVPRDDSKAYHYFNQVVEDYDEDKPELAERERNFRRFRRCRRLLSERHTEQRGGARSTARARIIPICGDDFRGSERTVQSCSHVHDRRGRAYKGQCCRTPLAGPSRQGRPSAIASFTGTYALRRQWRTGSARAGINVARTGQGRLAESKRAMDPRPLSSAISEMRATVNG